MALSSRQLTDVGCELVSAENK